MKKGIFVAAALFVGSVALAQQKIEQPPPPPPPPVTNLNEVPPPPPPPPKPVAPPLKTKMSLPKDYQAFLKHNPAVKGISWSENKVRVHLKSGKEEVYDLNKEEEMKSLKDKYGELPAAPPPPPPPPAIKIKGC